MPIFKRQALKEKDRKFFTKVKNAIPLPNLIEIQTDSYNWFTKIGIKELFEEVSPITDFSGRNLELYLEDYYLDEPRFDEVTCKKRNVSYEAPLRITARLLNKNTNQSKSQEIYLGDIPMMTQRGTFIVNGIERVIVSQLIRSAGAFFTAENVRGRRYYGAKIIPNRGAWLEIETDQNNALWVKVDRKRKVAVTSLLRAFGVESDEDIIKAFKHVNNHPTIDFIDATLKKDLAKNMDEGLIEVYKRIRPGDLATPDNAKGLIHAMFFNFERYDLGRVGVYKFNNKFDVDSKPEDYDNKENRVLSSEKLIAVISEIIRLNVTQEEP
ncbi:MAG: DNA-directed RNA polymerase subunit beta, partial [Candidatus Magasanikbacteria bacterium]|nr:DNA-directed RNA polymerase subunit beta [Candidatus Magasanikbacteria bacterium]